MPPRSCWVRKSLRSEYFVQATDTKLNSISRALVLLTSWQLIYPCFGIDGKWWTRSLVSGPKISSIIVILFIDRRHGGSPRIHPQPIRIRRYDASITAAGWPKSIGLSSEGSTKVGLGESAECQRWPYKVLEISCLPPSWLRESNCNSPSLRSLLPPKPPRMWWSWLYRRDGFWELTSIAQGILMVRRPPSLCILLTEKHPPSFRHRPAETSLRGWANPPDVSGPDRIALDHQYYSRRELLSSCAIEATVAVVSLTCLLHALVML